MKKILVVSLFLILLPVLTFAQTSWKPTDYEISFKIKNAGITVTGRFTGLKATLLFNPDDLAKSSLSASVEVATVKTGIDKRDKDLQEEQYFNTDKFKVIEIKSTKLYKKGDQYAGMFNVTIKGVTKQVEIPFEFNKTATGAEFKGSFGLNRRDFGVGGKSMMMSDDLTVTIDIKAKS